MPFTDGKPFTVLKEDLKRPWSGGRNGEHFRCYLCGYRFKERDTVRWQFTNDVPGAAGNPLVCQNCDGTKEEIVAKWKQMISDAKERMWWFTRFRD